MTFHEAQFLQQSLKENHHEVPSMVQEKMLRYLSMMREWNRVFNLTSITQPKEMILLHLLDSLSVNPFLHGDTIIDIGTGAGLPGIPLALVNPNKKFVLLDSNQKKIRFLNQVIYDLNINNVETAHARVEKYEHQRFDSILSRAFSSLKVMLETTKHLLSDTGQFLAMKGIYPEKELKDIPAEFNVIAVHKLTIYKLNAERHLVCMEKKHSWEK